MDHNIKNKGKMFLNLDQQLLVYIRIEKGIAKSRVVNAIWPDFFLLGNRKELVISTPIGFAVNSICGSIMHTALGIINKIEKNYQCKISA